MWRQDTLLRSSPLDAEVCGIPCGSRNGTWTSLNSLPHLQVGSTCLQGYVSENSSGLHVLLVYVVGTLGQSEVCCTCSLGTLSLVLIKMCGWHGVRRFEGSRVRLIYAEQRLSSGAPQEWQPRRVHSRLLGETDHRPCERFWPPFQAWGSR